MNALTVAILWCMVQTLAILLVALVVIRCVIRQRPDVATATAACAISIVLITTLIVPVQLPNWMLLNIPYVNNSVTRLPFESSSESVDAALPVQPQVHTHTEFQFDLSRLLIRTGELGRHRPFNGHSLRIYLIIVCSCGILAGLIRCSLGLALLSALRRRATTIHDEQLETLSNSLAHSVGRHLHVTFAQSREVDCAAVVGYLHPTILFSNQWTSWTPDELRTVLAHELAHLQRGDTWWRLAGTVCTAIHFYNPLMHWLAERLVLAQELTADQLASRMIGGTRPYLRALAQLAIRQDGGPHVRPLPFLTPVFSGHFMRRIEMLQAMDCQQPRSPKRWLPAMVIATLSMFGVTTTLMRCCAQTGTAEQSNAVPSSGEHVTAATLQSAWVPFTREKLPESHPGLGKSGGLYLNLVPLKQSPVWPVFEGTLMEMMEDEKFSRGWDLRLLDSILSDANVSILKNDPQDQHEGRNRLAFGVSSFLLRTNCDIDWPTAIQSLDPKCVPGTVNGKKYWEAQLALGPIPLRMHPVTPRELGAWIADTRPETAQVDPGQWHIKPENRPQPEWSQEWNAASGGILTVFFTVPVGLKGLAAIENEPANEKLKVINQGIDLVTLGIDISPDSRTIEAKIRLRCLKSADSRLVHAAVQELLKLAQNETRKSSEQEKRSNLTGLDIQIFENAKTSVLEGSPQVVECRSRLNIPQDFFTTLMTRETPARKPVLPVPQVGAKPVSRN